MAVAAALTLVLASTLLRAAEIETEHLFGFLTGSDVGDVSEREVEGQTHGRFGKRTGSYAALSSGLAVEYTPIDHLRLEFGGSFAYHNIRGVDGLDDERRGAFEGLAFDLRYRLLDRRHAPFGLTLGVEPKWNRVDATTGRSVEEFGLGLALFADKELVPNRIVAAFNLVYEPELSRERSTGNWSREATLEVSTGITAQVRSGIFMAGEVRYLRSYEGLTFNAFSGHALFVGPAVYVQLSDRSWIGAAWSTQVAGRSVDDPASLDLSNFQRHEAKFKFGVNF
jgi:hypothetical protein